MDLHRYYEVNNDLAGSMPEKYWRLNLPAPPPAKKQKAAMQPFVRSLSRDS
jgi:hypothetical protein